MTNDKVYNKDILERINVIEALQQHRLDKLEQRQDKIESIIRGNGQTGLKARVEKNTEALAKIEKYFMAVVTAVSLTLIMQVLSSAGII